MIRAFVLAFCFLFAVPAAAQTLPALTGRVVDQAELLTPEQEATLTLRLEQLERTTSRQLVIVTVPDLQGRTVEDFGFALGEQWKIGDEEADNGAILLVALSERKIRIEVGDGLEAILTDAMSGLIIRDAMRPRFQAGDPAGGIATGVDAIIAQLQAPPEVAEQRALEAAASERGRTRTEGGGGGGGAFFPLIFWLIILFFVIIPLLRSGFRGRKYRGRRRGFGGPIVIWGPGGWGGGSSSSWGGGSWGGRGGGFGGGGFSGGGGSFGGGGASGGW